METVIVVETYDTEAEALRKMHWYARNLRRLHKTKRYGVFVEKREGTYWLCLNDRQQAP